ncbi:small ribosomal subunit protein uS10m isoform X1 [Gadus macrocephalus]|uniref:small ribosomal subunit protein uS10m isoform X1 n=1 Tax=Gadus macrocephalus TaxID=80720 RepID=UPI0028CB5340|nr:small ribosomal subunit protein uS10m isoform X1 [Gadus macrocephalus]
MAAPVRFTRIVCAMARISSGIPLLGLRSLNACRGHRSSQTLRASFHRASSLALTSSQITVTDEPDTLFQKVSVLVKGHDRSVLDSYEFFATMAAKELGITLGNVFEPPKDVLRLTLLKSIHIFKKHRVQYEMRTHYRCLELFRLTGSTAQVYLEYIQRNLPEGVAMEVSKPKPRPSRPLFDFLSDCSGEGSGAYSTTHVGGANR